MKSKTLRQMQPLLTRRFGASLTQTVLDGAQTEFDRLCTENKDQPKACRPITVENAYPCISLYHSLQKAGVPAGDALDFLDESFSILAQPKADSMRMMLKIPGVYRWMPAIFRKVTLAQFGEKQGFAATFYPTGKDICRFDMTRCKYFDTFTAYGCPELTRCLCHTDDVTNGNMHPHICWHRTQTLGEGGNVCDFCLYVTQDKKKN